MGESKTTVIKGADAVVMQEDHAIAKHLAEFANKALFKSRRGLFMLGGFGVCVYNNNPYAQFPAMRDEETSEIRKELEGNNIRVKAYALDSDNYTYAMLLDADETKIGRIDWIIGNAVENSARKMRSVA